MNENTERKYHKMSHRSLISYDKEPQGTPEHYLLLNNNVLIKVQTVLYLSSLQLSLSSKATAPLSSKATAQQ